MFHRVLPLDSAECRNSEREYVVGTDEFDRCLAFFGRHYNVVSLGAIEAAAAGGPPLPAHPLLITFDDGWRDNLTHAEPLLRRHGMKATLFVNIEAILQPGARWWQDALVKSVEQAQAAAADAPPARDFFTTLAVTLRRPLEDRLAAVLPRSDYQPENRQMLTVEEVATLDPQVWDLGSHGMTHSPLTNVPDPERELTDSQKTLATWQRKPVQAISMPHGRYSAGILNVARAVYSLVFTSDPYLVTPQGISHRRPLGRIHVPSSACVDETALARFLWIRRQR